MKHDLIVVYATGDASADLTAYLGRHLPDVDATGMGPLHVLFGNPPMDVSVQSPDDPREAGEAGATVVLVKPRLNLTPTRAQHEAAGLVFDVVGGFTDAKVDLISEDDTVIRSRDAADSVV
jgi:hypothetical protein